MRIVMASDHVGYDMKVQIAEMLKEMGHLVDDIGAHNAERADYPVYGKLAAEKVAEGEYDRAILICGTGFGISLAANRIKGIRCVNCIDSYTALLSRLHNNANAMALGARVIGIELAKMLVKIWIEAEFEGGRHAERVNMIDNC